MFLPKIKNQIKKPSLTRSVQHGTWSSAQFGQQEKVMRGKVNFSFFEHNVIIYVGNPKYLQKKAARTNLLFKQSYWYTFPRWKSVIFL